MHPLTTYDMAKLVHQEFEREAAKARLAARARSGHGSGQHGSDLAGRVTRHVRIAAAVATSVVVSLLAASTFVAQAAV